VTTICYFSGTGNSLWSAKKIAEHIGADSCELINIGIAAQKSEVIIEADAVVFVFPSYAFGPPVIVSRFARNAVFKTPYLAALVTYGSSPGGTLGLLRKILRKKGIGKMFFAGIPSVENYIALFGTPKTESIERRTAMQQKATEEAARSIIERQENRVNTFCPFSAFVSWLFSLGTKVLYKKYRLSDECCGCGVCEMICPVKAIAMIDGHPVFTAKCEHCQGCVNICPLRAIQFGRAKWGTPGYCHPEIITQDLSRDEDAQI